MESDEVFDLSISTIIHDLNNLLTTVISHATLALAKTEDCQESHPHLERTVQAAKYAAALSRQLNLYAKESLHQDDNTDLNNLVTEITELLRPVFLRNVTVHLDLGYGLPFIKAPKLKIQQILMNLLINAAEAIPPAGGAITLQTGWEKIKTPFNNETGSRYRFAPQPGEYLFLRVADTGVGMNENILDGLLMPYFTTKPRGRGLGLMSVVKILNDWGGGLLIKSRPRQGSTFSVYLPYFNSGGNAIG